MLCSTADSFATHRHEVAGDVVDMEAFALARVCLAENARFACVKYVTDGADSDSATHWEAALDNAARTFVTVYRIARPLNERTPQSPHPQFRDARRPHDGRPDARARRSLAEVWRGIFAAAAVAGCSCSAASAPRTLEIGFGNGEHLAALAAAHPERDYLGIEVHRPGVGHLLHAGGD